MIKYRLFDMRESKENRIILLMQREFDFLKNKELYILISRMI